MSGTCKHCWHFHVKGRAEVGTCRAGIRNVKMHKDDPCRNLVYYSPNRVEVKYTIHDKRGRTISGIKDLNDAIGLCNYSNREIRKQLMNERYPERKTDILK